MCQDISDKHTFVICAYRESPYLETCILSLLKQKCKSTVIIATSTMNTHIEKLADKYGIKIYVNEKKPGLASDWNFALQCAKTELVTLAHQDDLYEAYYSTDILEAYLKADKPIILFTDYYELRGKKRVKGNQLLRIKRFMLLPLRISKFQNSRFVRRRILSFGSPICCPAVTMAAKQMPENLFDDRMKCNADWSAWEELSKKKGSFVYIPKILMGHRIHIESTTSELLKKGVRKKEDIQIFEKFWPSSVAMVLEKFYQKSEKSNSL
jgi:glycosyltransferase involved in cell wall biosynthesis